MVLYDKFISVEELFERVPKEDIEWVNKREEKRFIKYANISCSFDIETTSFYIDNETGETYSVKDFDTLSEPDKIKFHKRTTKQNIMYIWMFGLNGYCVMGRTWDEFRSFVTRFCDNYGIDESHRIPCYVHNLSYEMSYLKDMFQFTKMFAREKREPMKALIHEGIEFRCSFVLSGCSLDLTAKTITKYKIAKKTGDLDYDTLRSPLTHLTEKELGYCIYDILVVMALIDEMIDMYENVCKIPMTNTGKVRRYCQEYIFGGRTAKAYKEKIHKMNITGLKEYLLLKSAYSGGFTHANASNANKIFTTDKKYADTHENAKYVTSIESKDFTSSYPAVICSEKGFPLSTGRWVTFRTLDEIDNFSTNHCIIFRAVFKNVESRLRNEHYYSFSKALNMNELIKDPEFYVDNGRIISCSRLDAVLTEVSLNDFIMAYSFDDDVEIKEAIVYDKGYLPKELIECVAHFYKKKTTLKDVTSEDGSIEREYLLYKGMLNSMYGDFVTDIINDEIEYNQGWTSLLDKFKVKKDDTVDEARLKKELKAEYMKECIDSYNENKKRYGFYPMGIYVCEYARHNLWSAIFELGDDYIYSDTDSVKYCNVEKHKEYFDNYNKEIANKIQKMCDFYRLDFNDFCPKTQEGISKLLGEWDFDGAYTKFATLGSKRYLVEYEEDGHSKVKCTIAGVNKKKTSEWLNEMEDPFEYFLSPGFIVPYNVSGRLIASYIDERQKGVIIDVEGNEYHYDELSSVHFEKGPYHLTLNPAYALLIGYKEKKLI